MKSYNEIITINPINGIIIQQILNNLPLFVEVTRKRSTLRSRLYATPELPAAHPPVTTPDDR